MPRNRAAMRRRAERQASPFLCFRPPNRRPMQKGWGFALPPYSHERTTIIRYVVKKMAAKLSRQVSCKATPARPIKKKSTCAAGRGAGCPAGRAVPESPLGQFWQRLRRGRARDFPQSNRPRQARQANKEKSSVRRTEKMKKGLLQNSLKK